MKIRTSFLTVFFNGVFFQAQIGIGTTTPDVSAVLEMVSTEKGLLVSRMNNIDMSNIVNPATSLLVYNVENKSYLGFDGAQWSFNLFSPDNQWSTKGNTGNSGSNFIGTTSNVNLNFRTNGNVALSILPSRQVRIEGISALSKPRLNVYSSSPGTSFPSINGSNSNGTGGTSIAVTTMVSNTLNGSVRGTYAFANTVGEAEAGISSAGISYIQDTNVSGLSFYTGGHPSGIDDRSKESMMISNTRNVGINVHDPKAKLDIGGGDIYINDPNSGIIMIDSGSNCRRITVTDLGTLDVSNIIPCP